MLKLVQLSYKTVMPVTTVQHKSTLMAVAVVHRNITLVTATVVQYNGTLMAIAVVHRSLKLMPTTVVHSTGTLSSAIATWRSRTQDVVHHVHVVVQTSTLVVNPSMSRTMRRFIHPMWMCWQMAGTSKTR